MISSFRTPHPVKKLCFISMFLSFYTAGAAPKVIKIKKIYSKLSDIIPIYIFTKSVFTP